MCICVHRAPAVVICSTLALLCVGELAEAKLPPDAKLVWASNREGGKHEIFVTATTTAEGKRLTSAGGINPAWSPDGEWISYLTSNGYPTRIMRSDGSDERQIHRGICKFWMSDGSGLVCLYGDRFFLVDPETGDEVLLLEKKSYTKMTGARFDLGGISPDGRWLLVATDRYRLGFAGTNGNFKARWAVAALDRQAPDKVFFVGGGCGPTASPTENTLYHSCGGGFGECLSAPDIYRFDLSGLPGRSSYAAEAAAPDNDWGHEYSARISTDGAWLTYVGSLGCHDQLTCDYEVFLHQLGSSHTTRTRLTTNSANDQHPHLYVARPEEGCRVVEGAEGARARWWPGALALLAMGLLLAGVRWRFR